jgi:hypothetical protein
LLRVPWTTLIYKSRKKPQEPLRRRLREIAATYVRYGYRRLTVLLRREGWKIGAKRIYRLYDEENLKVRSVERKKIARRQRVPQAQASGPNQCWSADFVSDKLTDGRTIRILTVIDQFTRECVWLEADRSMNGPKVVAALTQAITERGAGPRSMTLDNGSEFDGRWRPGRYKPACSSALSGPDDPWRTGSSKASTGGCGMNASTSNGSRRSKKRAVGWRCGAITTITSGRTAPWMTGHLQCLPLCTESGGSASPCSTPIRQTANRVKGSLRRLRPPLTRSTVCLKILDIRAKRFHASLKPETLY